MKFVVLWEGKTIPVEIEKRNGEYCLTLMGKRLTVNAIRPDQHTLSLLVDGKSYEVGLEKRGNSFSIHFYDDTIAMELFEARKFKAKEVTKKANLEGPFKVVSPMPGKIVKIAVKENSSVREGDSLIIMEAMKMQNELKAPRTGIVKQIHVKEGEPVLPLQTLVILE